RWLRQFAQLSGQLFGVTDELHDVWDRREVAATVLSCALERAADGFDDLGGADGFHQEVESAAAKRAYRGFERRARCQKENTRRRTVEREGGECVGELQAAHVRHVEVADDYRDLLTRGDGRQRLLRIAATGAF